MPIPILVIEFLTRLLCMKISIIVAMASNRAIGINNQLPWHLSADLKKFKHLTMGHPILMGRKTYESIGRPLPGRTNLVISRNPNFLAPGCHLFQNIESALEFCQSEDEIFIIGGVSFYSDLLAHADFIYLTEIHKNFQGDSFFPELDMTQWQELSRENIQQDSSVDFHYSFVKLGRL